MFSRLERNAGVMRMGTGEMTQRSGSLAAPPEALGLIPTIHMAVHSTRDSSTASDILAHTGTRQIHIHRHTCRENTHMYEIRILKNPFKNVDKELTVCMWP